MTPRRFTLGSIALLLAAAIGVQAREPARAPDVPGARSAVDWPGTYMGTLPAASGGGFRTVLILRQGDRYTLTQDIEHQGRVQALQSNGPLRWDQTGSVVTLGDAADAQRFGVGEGFVELRGNAPPPPNLAQAYRLARMQSYAGADEELLVDPGSIRPDQPRPGWVSFDGVWNMNHPTQAGHQSLAAHFELNCKAREYRMPTIAYYSQPYRRGQLIDSAKNNDDDIPLPPQDGVMSQVLRAHCPR